MRPDVRERGYGRGTDTDHYRVWQVRARCRVLLLASHGFREDKLFHFRLLNLIDLSSTRFFHSLPTWFSLSLSLSLARARALALSQQSIVSAYEDDEEWNGFTPTPLARESILSAHEEESPDATPTPPASRFKLAAHTPNATAMTEKLINGTISQKDYDKRIMSTSIKLITRVASMPVIMTLDDSLAEVLAQAVNGLDMSSPVRQQTTLYLWCSTKLLHSIGRMHCVSGRSAILDRSSLKDLF